MEWILIIIILIGLAMIDNTIRKILKLQDARNQKVVALLAEIRDKQGSK